MFSARVSILE